MIGEWKVTAKRINGETMYRVYRQIDTSTVDHPGNREYVSDYISDWDACVLIAELVNGLE